MKLITILVVNMLLFACSEKYSSTNQFTQNSTIVLDHEDSIAHLLNKETVESERRNDSLKIFFPEELVKNLFIQKDSIFKNVLIKTKMPKSLYKTRDSDNYCLENISYYKCNGEKLTMDSIGFWIYLDKNKGYEHLYFWADYSIEKDTIIQIGKYDFQYLSYYDDVYFGNKGIVAYPTILKPKNSDQIIFFNFDTVYTDNKYLYTKKAYLHGDNAIYSKFEYRNGAFCLVSEEIALDKPLPQSK